MVKVNLVLTDYLTGKKSSNEGKLMAVNSIKELLNQIDFKAELVPENNLEMFTRLLTSLKGEPLSKQEKELIGEIVNYWEGVREIEKWHIETRILYSLAEVAKNMNFEELKNGKN